MRRLTARLLVGGCTGSRRASGHCARGVTTRHPDCTGSTTPMPCIRTRHLATRLLVGRSHWLSSCVWSLRLAVRLLVVRIAPALHAYDVHPDAPSRRSTSRRSVAMALVVRPGTASRDATTRRPNCTDTTAPMLCIPTRHLAARLLVGRSHWLSSCVQTLRLAPRLLVVRIAPALLRLCRASGRTISPLNFSLVGRTSSRRVSGHCVSRRDYLSSGLHRLYCSYVVYPDALSRRSTFRQSVALALAFDRSFRCAS
jgi:hypothetical protein